ncbi:MAG: ribose-phosphate pyrophosphokinase [Firmicutes bacterium]|nr:ribose-phosphate pyrophosphokinase [Bacillota bacterium]
MNNNDLSLIVMENCKEFGKKVDEHLMKLRKSKTSFILPVDAVRFSDGEGKVKLLASIRGKDVYILSDTHNYSIKYKMYGKEHMMSPDEHFQDIKRTILAMMGHAKRITVIMPFLYESRQHRRKSRESLDCALALQELKALGVDNIITFDAHDPNVQNAVPTLAFDNFFPTNDILSSFLKNEVIDKENTLVISPDAGAMDRARYLADIIKVDVGLFYKRRDLSKVVNGSNPIEAHEYLGKDLEGKTAIVVDDMIASGRSLIDVAEELKKRKAKKIYFFSTFALFTSGPDIFIKSFKEKLFEKIYSTNLTYVPEEILEKEWFVAADCSKFLAEIVDYNNSGKSISELIVMNTPVPKS